MTTISACIIVKNEEQFLEECLNSIKDLADEIIIVDTGSTDKSIEIAKKFTDKRYTFAWINDFAKARNFSLTKATSDWILIIDSDEVIAKKDHPLIKKLLEETPFHALSIIQRNYTDKTQQPLFKATDERYKEEAKNLPGYVPSEMIRLFRNKKGIAFTSPVHETVIPTMRKLGFKFARTDIPIHHYQHLKSKEQHEEKLEGYIKLLQEKERKEPTNIKNLHDLAIVYLEQKRDLKTAFNYFKKIYEHDNELLEPYLGMGIIYGRLGKIEKAIMIFNKALQNQTKKTIEMRTDHERIRQTILYNLANILTKANKNKEAKKAYELLLQTSFPMKEKIKEQLGKLK